MRTSVCVLNIRPLRQRFRKSWTTKRPYGALRKATSEVTRLTMQHLEGDEAHRPSHIVATAAATFYAFGLLLPAGSWFLMWLYATHGRRIVDNRLDPGYLRRMTVQYGGSVALYLGAVLLSLIDFRWGLGLCVGLTLLYLLPPPRPRYVDDQS
jgi:hypothetical protein